MIKLRALWARLRSGQLGWPALMVAFLLGAASVWGSQRVLPRAARAMAPRPKAPRTERRLPPRLEDALRWLRTWPEHSLSAHGSLTESDFALAEGGLLRFRDQFPADPSITAQLAIQDAADGSDRDAQVFESRAFARLCAAPERSVRHIAAVLRDQEERRDAGQMLRLLLAISRASGPSKLLQATFHEAFTRPTLATEPGSDAAVIALYGYLASADPAAQKAAVREALAAQSEDPAMVFALHGMLLVRTEDLLH
jgi:hypothetical protein